MSIYPPTGTLEIKNAALKIPVVDLQYTSNTAKLEANSNVVTEFSRSKKLIKYPRVALTSAAQTGSGYENYFVSQASATLNGTSDRQAWAFFDTQGPGQGTTLASPHLVSSADRFDTSGNYTGGDSLADVSGDWIYIRLPDKIQLQFVDLWARYDNQRNPIDATVLGSLNGTNWSVIGSWKNANFTAGSSTRFTINSVQHYDYIGFVFEKIEANSSGKYVNFHEIDLYGVPEYDPEGDGTDLTLKSLPNVPNTDWLEVYYDAKGLTPGAVTSVSDLKPSSLGTALNSSSTNNITVTDDAFVFNGTDSYIKIDDLTNPSGAWVHSVVAWINPLDLGGNFDLTWIGDVDSATTRQSFTFNTSVQVTMGINGNNVKFQFVSPLTKDKWHHVVYTFNGGAAGSDSTAYRVFVDGVEAYKATGVGSGTLTLPAQTALWIGRNHGGSNYFNGKIANLRLFNRALTTDEIHQLYAYQKEYFGHGDLSMTLKAGRLGIGTSEPRAALDVRGDVYSGCPVFWFASSQSTSGFLNYNQVHVNKGGGIQGDKFIAPISGYYHMTLHSIGDTGTSRTHRLEWYLNGVEIGFDGIFGLYATTGGNAHYQNIAGSLIWYMNAGDYMQVYVHDSSMNGNLNGWSGFLLST